MTDIIECENELNKWKNKNKLDIYYPYIVSLLENFDTKETFLASCNNPNSGSIRREWYNLFGYPKQLPNGASDVSQDIVLCWSRINGYPFSVVKAFNNPSLFTEFCVYNQVSSLPIEDIKSSLGLALKYINPQTSEQDVAAIRTQLPISDRNNLDFIKLHQKSTDLNSTEDSIHYTDKDIPDNIIAWKRLRNIVKMFLKSSVSSVPEMLLNIVHSMTLVEDNVFSNVKGDLDALVELKKLIAMLPYSKSSDKEFLLNYVNTFMEQKDIVKMLPQFKDKWINGRLVFEIGDDSKDLFNCYKGVMNTKYFVITVNPVDMLFCSTDQEYHSCFGLDSPHGSNKGLVNFLARPDTCMCFLSSGSLSKPWKHENYTGLSFNHIKIKARAFIYNSKDLDMADVGRCYAPSEICNSGRDNDCSLSSFRTDARLFLWKLLQESGQTFNLEQFVSNKILRQCLSSSSRTISCGFTFQTSGLIERKFEKHRHNEVYFDNLSFDRENQTNREKEGTYYAHTGDGSCSAFNAMDGNLGTLYRAALQECLDTRR